MIRYALDTDHVTLHFRGQSQVGQKLSLIPPDEIAITTITAEEQLRGRLAQIKKASTADALAMAHSMFRLAIHNLAKLNILKAHQSSDLSEFEQNWPRTLDNFFLVATIRTVNALRLLSDGRDN